ncbi:MAG: bifunctional YncE family protein/alkaline phosphatase family protein [Ktedonobacteraceae bacterium]|nr:bifunctional YncE family protein/alkaline phosphatase family protein [Ktedonobacteraceae bacterium]
MQRYETSTFYRIRYFLQQHRKLALLTGLLLVALTIVPSTIFAGVRVFPDNQPGTNGNKTRLINNWTITPAGIQTALGDWPVNAVLSPNGRNLLVTNSGAGIQSLQVIDTATNGVVQTIPYYVPDSVFVGLAYSPDGKHAYASGGGADVVHTYNVLSSGKLAATGNITIGTTAQNPFPTGLSVSPDGKTLYVANNLANTVTIVNTLTRTVTATVKIGTYPYTTLVSKDGKTVYASNWGDATVSVIDASKAKVVATIATGNHPTAMTFGPGHLLFVTDSNSDAISVIDTTTNKETRKISLAPYKNAPLSSSPVGLAVSANQKYLYVSNAGENAIAVIALNGASGPEKVLGRIPTAWYPTSVVTTKDGTSLFVTNGYGRGAGPNDKGAKKLYPNPTRQNPPIVDGITGYNDKYCNCTFDNYSGAMTVGTLSKVTIPGKGLLDLYSSQVASNDHVGDTSLLQRDAGNPIPVPGGTSPIKHVIYIVKENRTYDQIFGDESVGNNDPSLTLFPSANTPNLHALADRFGIFDNFYADAEVSADGHNWINSANASDYNEKMWPQDYSPGPGRNRGYDFEGGSAINLSPGGYLWDSAAQAKITYRDYGEFYQADANASVSNAKLIPASQANTCTGPVAHSYSGITIPAGQVLCFLPMDINPQTTPNLVGHYDPQFRTFDMSFRESDRIAEWQREYQQFVTNNNLPQLTILRLPNDHTSGTSVGKITPQAAVAENDYAVGQVVDTVSHSKYWGSTTIFITEDDAQNGPDHVDAHRTEALVVSPYTSRSTKYVDHTLYDTAAMVRTMELILGLRTLSQYDAAATPMWRDFHSGTDTAPYTALAEKYPPTLVNGTSAFGAAQSAQMNFTVADAIPEDPLNQILWHAIKGDTAYPGIVGGASSSAAGDTDG